ncbi:MAG: TetR/AcrR family transcriptional regulator [Spirochaetaceae bacterium]|jgi:AcrR family transcriptional regulator|nr:TetR/AcrR family transcriptional regulator [Spirochaetaceae bacterium]
MKRNTRQEILSAAKKLFAERGYNAVSVQDIAGALGISKGNLTYYFKKKEHIIEAIIAESPGGPPSRAPRNFAELDYFLLDIQQVVQSNAYYFWHITQLAQLSPKIHEKQKNIYRTNVALLTGAFETFLKAGLIRKEEFPGEFRRVIDLILLSSIYWLPFCALKQEPAEYRKHAWGILYPLMTRRGKDAFRADTGIDLRGE